MMKKLPSAIATFCLMATPLLGFCQQKTVLVYDVMANTFDSISVSFDSTISSDFTEHFIGLYNDEVAELEQSAPTENIFPNSQFTRKQKVDNFYEVTDYPIRTSVKIFSVDSDTLNDNCSGSMISTRHVLTAAHCISEVNTNEVIDEQLEVCPIYNNGNLSSDFDCSRVAKIYFFKNWSLGKEDVAVLELSEPIGEQTGWLGVGFSTEDAVFEERIFYKFPYPASSVPSLDPGMYNGDTLYFNYGFVDLTQPNFLGIRYANAMPGESGSSLIEVENHEVYRTYGTLSFSHNLRHTRLNNWMFYSIKEIIANDLMVDVEAETFPDFDIFPNPASGQFFVRGLEHLTLEGITIYDQLGRKVLLLESLSDDARFDLSRFPGGIYYVSFQVNDKMLTRKVVKK